jgi:hypothetical protein
LARERRNFEVGVGDFDELLGEGRSIRSEVPDASQ